MDSSIQKVPDNLSTVLKLLLFLVPIKSKIKPVINKEIISQNPIVFTPLFF